MEEALLSDIAKSLNIKMGKMYYWINIINDLKNLTYRKTTSRLKGNYGKLYVKDSKKFIEILNNILLLKEENKENAYLLERLRNSQIDWTPSAIECYENSCNCTNCLLWDIACKKANFKKIPPMKSIVVKTLEILGEPNEGDRI